MIERLQTNLTESDLVNISYLNWVLIENKGRMSIENLAQYLMSKFPKQYNYDPLQQDFLKVRQIAENMISAYVNMGCYKQEGNVVYLKKQEEMEYSFYLNRCKEIIQEFKDGKNHFPENLDPSCDMGYLQMVLATEFSPKGNGNIWQMMYEKFEKMLEMFYKDGHLKDEDFPNGEAYVKYVGKKDDAEDGDSERYGFEHDDDGA